jgi:BioD-like phosphotransacetylase family protein
VTLDPARVGRDAGRIAEEVISHFAAQVGAKVTVTLEIEAVLEDGASDQLIRTVTENGRTLRFTSQGFEDE